MFDTLSDRLTQSLRSLTGKSLTERNIQASMRDVRIALLEADVALEVVTSFVKEVQNKAIGQKISSSVDAGNVFVKIVHDELVQLMGDANDALNLSTTPPAIILMAGLQGVGKTTTVAKLARYLIERDKKKVSLVSTDIYRPAAIDQLRTLADEVGAFFIESHSKEDPIVIAERAQEAARRRFDDILIVDTAGRLAVDEQMMAEIGALHGAMSPVETLFVVDSMSGQDAVVTAKAFDLALPLTGIILSKTDGDARGGAALSVRAITGKPIKFLGTGEKTDGLEAFYPERIASRILGMGDVLTLMEEAERKVDKKKANRLAKKISKGRKFDLLDFRDQLQQMEQMGGVSNLMEKMPGMTQVPEAAQSQLNDSVFRKMTVIIDSMTKQERRFPDVINGSRKKRIATGSGSQVQEINRLLKQHKQMQKMMKKVSRKGGMDSVMRGLQQNPGGLSGGRRRRR